MERNFSQNNEEDIDRQVNDAYKKRQQKIHRGSSNTEFLDEVIEVTEITKRVIGKVMVKYCGHEGTQRDERTASLWTLLQAVIDFLQTTSKKINWANAEITVYDIDDNSFRITSGHGKHQYVVSDAGNGDAEIINTSNKAQKVKPDKPSHSTTHHPGKLAANIHHRAPAPQGHHPYHSQPASESHHGYRTHERHPHHKQGKGQDGCCIC